VTAADPTTDPSFDITAFLVEAACEPHYIEGVLAKPAIVGVAVALITAIAFAGVAGAKAPLVYKNCTNLNKKYPHGVGRLGARDKTSGAPVTTFKRSTLIYRRAMSYNRGLDRDKDGIACEKA
jgi:Excalibur calcium-binding domain